MSTIMERWANVKVRLQAAVAAAIAAGAEAEEIVRERCGQNIYPKVQFAGGYFEANSKHTSTLKHACFTSYFTKLGEWHDGFGSGTRPVREQHIAASLAETEAVTELLEEITTGDFISQWEATQQSATTA